MDGSIATSLDHLQMVFDRQKQAFSFATVPSVKERKEMLKRLEQLFAGHKEELITAIGKDFGTRSPMETLSAEVAMSVINARQIRKNLDDWARKRRVWNHSSIPGKTYVRYEPKGVVGVIAPWNYPFQLAAIPLTTALAAGNAVMLKPSEITPYTADFMKEMFAKEFEETQVAVVTGGPEVGEAFSSLPFDHLFYTGSTQVGRLVAMAAAKNLTPVTLELGGKSPTILLDDADVEKSAQTIAMGKFYNAGQTCVAPDYLLVPQGKGEAYASAIIDAVTAFYPEIADNEDYSSIVSDRHYVRMNDMIDEAGKNGGTVRQAEADKQKMSSARKVSPTVILNPPAESKVMQEEIFGPILPIVEVGSTDEAVAHVTARDHPLALYAYSNNEKAAEAVLDKTTSGGACINGTLMHVSVDDIPFGGVGKSGYGAYHGERGFREFSHERSVLVMPKWLPPKLLTPPYTNFFKNMVNKQIGK
ncbi:MAG: coniferyl aldehyde dehydrogenase [Aquisalinus sp.]|nr:coniferyl aldehyde dehydrogenase [Aquisalinus sp.]